MSSQIRTFLDNLAALDVTVGSVTPRVWNVNEVKARLNSGDAPLRMLSTVADPISGESATFVALGKLQQITWLVRDRCFWKAAAQGMGIEEVSVDLIDYMAAYHEAIRDNRALGGGQWHVVGLRATPGVFEWPPGGTAFFGVDCVLTIDEYVSGA